MCITLISPTLLKYSLVWNPTCRTAKHGDNAPEIADVYFAYGKALLENAISQSSVLGKEQGDETLEAENGVCHLTYFRQT